MNSLDLPRAVAERRRMNPVAWTVVGGIVGAMLAFDWTDPARLSLKLDIFLIGLFSGVFVTVIVAAWPRERNIPEVACPRCGHRMKWDVVVCPECGEIR